MYVSAIYKMNQANQSLFHNIQETARGWQYPASTSRWTRANRTQTSVIYWYIPGNIETRWDVVNARRWQKINWTPSRSRPTFLLWFFTVFFSIWANSNMMLAWYFSDVVCLIAVFVHIRYYVSKKYRVAIICIGESETITIPDSILFR